MKTLAYSSRTQPGDMSPVLRDTACALRRCSSRNISSPNLPIKLLIGMVEIKGEHCMPYFFFSPGSTRMLFFLDAGYDAKWFVPCCVFLPLEA